MTSVLAIDPGSSDSAYVVLGADRIVTAKGKIANAALLGILRRSEIDADHLAVEMIASYGMAVGAEVFETCVWIGKFCEAWQSRAGKTCSLVYRKEVKLHLCNSLRAKDANVRAALIDRWGGKDAAIGRKATPGPLFGFSADTWSALAVALTYLEVPR